MRGSREETRDLLLAGGIRLYCRHGTDALRGLTAGAVAEEAGFHRQTFYRYWETREQYLADLVELAFDADGPLGADGVVVLPERRGSGRDPATLLADVARYDIARITSDPVAALRLGLLAAGMGPSEPDGIDQRVAGFYDRAVTRLADGYARLLDEWGRDLRPPHSSRDLARIVLGLVIGMGLLHQAMEEQPTTERLYEVALTSLLATMTEDEEGSGTSDDGASHDRGQHP